MRHTIFITLSLLLISAIPSNADNYEPIVKYGVYTVVSTGPTYYGGERLMAVLEYGEVGHPYLTIEKVKIVFGSHPSESKVLWRKKIDIAGDKSQKIFPPSEYWKGEINNLHWDKDKLIYMIILPGLAYACIVNDIETKDLIATCTEAER